VNNPSRTDPYPVLYRSNRFLVIDKPAGIPVHPDRSGRPSIEDAFPAWRRVGHDGPWLAHRLDTDTSGCLLIGLRKQALVAAQACFAEGRVRKLYWAVVEGTPSGQSGDIAQPLAKRGDRRGWRMAVDPAGVPARTLWRLLGSGGGRSLLELTLLTGRTHQARVHCAWLGCPIAGDPVYGTGGMPMQLLSRRIMLDVAGEIITAEAAPPVGMAEAIARMTLLP